VSGLRVALVDDHRLLAQALALALGARGHEAVLVDPAGGAPAVVGDPPPDVVLLDLHLGADDPTGGDQLVGAVAPLVPVLVLTAETDRARWGRCLRSGARAVVSKEADLERVIAAVEAVAAGRQVLDEPERTALMRAAVLAERDEAARLAPFRQLTPREQAVLAAVVDGVPALEIAQTSSVSEATVRTQIRAVLAKLGVHSQLAAAAAARRAGWERDAA
jgi:DNA-binding NarL/FixJ family response regulator